jgi:Flp pilus assembly protein TadD
MKRALLAMTLAACGARSTAPSAPVRAEVEKAETAEKARKHDEARKHYQAAIANAKDPASIAFARREYAETLISWGEYPEAIVQLEGSAAAKGDDASLWHDLGLLYHNAGDDQRAIAALEKSRTLAPEDPRPRVSLGVLRWKRGDLAGARAEYQGLLELELPDRLREKAEWAVQELTKLVAARQAQATSP